MILNQGTKKWRSSESQVRKRVREENSAKNVSPSVLWDAKGTLLVNYLKTGKTISQDYYCNLFDQLHMKIHEKMPNLKKKKVILHQDNASTPPAHKTVPKITEIKYELQHSLYLADLAPSDFWLVPHLKKFLRGYRFSANNEVIAEINGNFTDLRENHYRDRISKLENHWNKFVKVKEDRTEK